MRFADRLHSEMCRLFEMMDPGVCGKIHIHLYMDLVNFPLLLLLTFLADNAH